MYEPIKLSDLGNAIDIAMQTDGTGVKTESINQMLANLLYHIDTINFETLAFPNIKELKTELEAVTLLVLNLDGTDNDANHDDIKKFQKLTKQIAGFKLSKNHYLIICVEQLLKIAIDNNWGLCKKNNFIYLYNGAFGTK